MEAIATILFLAVIIALGIALAPFILPIIGVGLALILIFILFFGNNSTAVRAKTWKVLKWILILGIGVFFLAAILAEIYG